MNTSDPKVPLRASDLPAYRQAIYLRYLDQMADHGLTGAGARAHARAAAWRAADAAQARIEKAWPTHDTLDAPPTKKD